MAREFAKAFYASQQWQQVRYFCLMRDKYLCVECGHPAEEVHHIIHLTPENIWDTKISLNPDNLKCLCRSCHFEAHRGEHGKGRAKTEETPEYYFDENGYLVPGRPPC